MEGEKRRQQGLPTAVLADRAVMFFGTQPRSKGQRGRGPRVSVSGAVAPIGLIVAHRSRCGSRRVADREEDRGCCRQVGRWGAVLRWPKRNVGQYVPLSRRSNPALR